MAVDFTSTVQGVAGVISQLEKDRQVIKDAAYFAAINSAEKAREAILPLMSKVFDRPTPLMLRSLRITNKNGGPVGKNVTIRRTGGQFERRAQTEFSVLLGFIDASPTLRSDPVTDSLFPNVEGGPRRAKPSELRLRRERVLEANEYIIPSRTAKRNRFGNIPSGEYVRMLSDLRTFSEAGFTANSTYKTGRGHYLVVESRGFKGIFKSRGGYGQRAVQNAELMWIVVKGAPKYNKRFPFYETATSVYLKNYPREFDEVSDRLLRRSANA